MHLKLIACEVFYREICHCIARGPHVVDVDFTEKGAHNESDVLRELLQSKIDEASNGNKEYDAILLGFGLCGNSTTGLISRGTKVVIPRAHDCCTIFLGSREKFKEHFGDNPSRPFSSAGYMERGEGHFHDAEMRRYQGMDKTYEEYVELYGEENAKYLVDVFQSSLEKSGGEKVVYIEMPETAHLGFAEKCRKQAAEQGKAFIQVDGDMRLIRNLVFGEWDDNDFLVLKPNQHTVGVYDLDEIIRAENKSDNSTSPEGITE